MFWNDQYERCNKIWGDRPSELAFMAVSYLDKTAIKTESLSVLDVACGYGRNTFYLHERLGCRVTGVDISLEAIRMADASLSDAQKGVLQFIHGNFMDFQARQFDVLFVSNFYHLLDRQERNRFLGKVVETLKPNGRLFLSTHSIRDPQLYGKGIPHPAEPHTYYHKEIYRHFSSAETMGKDFHSLEIERLFEHEYLEPRKEMEPHHHISWILVGKLRG